MCLDTYTQFKFPCHTDEPYTHVHLHCTPLSRAHLRACMYLRIANLSTNHSLTLSIPHALSLVRTTWPNYIGSVTTCPPESWTRWQQSSDSLQRCTNQKAINVLSQNSDHDFRRLSLISYPSILLMLLIHNYQLDTLNRLMPKYV